MSKKKTKVAEDLILGFKELAEALDNEGGEIGGKFTCYQMELDLKPESYTPEMVKATRKKLAASQSVFAKFLGVSVKTVSQWEQGQGSPSGMACRFLDEIRRNPDYYLKRLRESVVPKNGRRKATV